MQLIMLTGGGEGRLSLKFDKNFTKSGYIILIINIIISISHDCE